MSGRQLFQYDATFGYRFIPGLRTRVEHESGGYLVRVNSAGFRCDHEFTPAKLPGTFRILLFGDSYTAGDGVSNRARYGDVLERLAPGIEVFNFGLPNSGTDQHYLVFRELARDIEHDLVVIAVQVENIRRNPAHYRLVLSEDGRYYALPKPYFVRESAGRLTLKNVPVPRDPVLPEKLPESERRSVDFGGSAYGLREWLTRHAPRVKQWLLRHTRHQPLPAYKRGSHPDWLLMKDILAKWVGECSRPALIITLPLYHFVEESADAKPYQTRFAEFARGSGVRVHDTLPDFLCVPAEQRRSMRFPIDVHPTPAAHEVIARSLLAALQPLLPREFKA